jgi:hypothetical protein
MAYSCGLLSPDYGELFRSACDFIFELPPIKAGGTAFRVSAWSMDIRYLSAIASTTNPAAHNSAW